MTPLHPLFDLILPITQIPTFSLGGIEAVNWENVAVGDFQVDVTFDPKGIGSPEFYRIDPWLVTQLYFSSE